MGGDLPRVGDGSFKSNNETNRQTKSCELM